MKKSKKYLAIAAACAVAFIYTPQLINNYAEAHVLQEDKSMTETAYWTCTLSGAGMLGTCK